MISPLHRKTPHPILPHITPRHHVLAGAVKRAAQRVDNEAARSSAAYADLVLATPVSSSHEPSSAPVDIDAALRALAPWPEETPASAQPASRRPKRIHTATTIRNHPFLKLDTSGRISTLLAHMAAQAEISAKLITLPGLIAHFDVGRSTMLGVVNAAIATGRLVRVHKTCDKPFHYLLPA